MRAMGRMLGGSFDDCLLGEGSSWPGPAYPSDGQLQAIEPDTGIANKVELPAVAGVISTGRMLLARTARAHRQATMRIRS